MAFGMGRSICPGRFLVTNEVKIMLARMLLDYEVRLFKKSSRPGVVCFGFEMFE